MHTGRRNGKSRFSLQWMTGTAMMIAVTILLGCTPLGMIRTPVLTATTMHIPVIIATLALGLEAGVVTGLVFGVQSLINNLTSASFFGPFFLNPLVSVLPRLLFPCCVYGLKKLAEKAFGERAAGRTLSYVAASAMGTAAHTAMVMGMIYLIYGGRISAMLQAGAGVPEAIASRGAGMGIAVMAAVNGVPEMIVAALAAPAVALALDKVLRRGKSAR